MKEKIYVVMRAKINQAHANKKNGIVDILFASKNIKKAEAFRDKLSPLDWAAVYPIQLDQKLAVSEEPALSISLDDLQ